MFYHLLYWWVFIIVFLLLDHALCQDVCYEINQVPSKCLRTSPGPTTPKSRTTISSTAVISTTTSTSSTTYTTSTTSTTSTTLHNFNNLYYLHYYYNHHNNNYIKTFVNGEPNNSFCNNYQFCHLPTFILMN